MVYISEAVGSTNSGVDFSKLLSSLQQQININYQNTENMNNLPNGNNYFKNGGSTETGNSSVQYSELPMIQNGAPMSTYVVGNSGWPNQWPRINGAQPQPQSQSQPQSGMAQNGYRELWSTPPIYFNLPLDSSMLNREKWQLLHQGNMPQSMDNTTPQVQYNMNFPTNSRNYYENYQQQQQQQPQQQQQEDPNSKYTYKVIYETPINKSQPNQGWNPDFSQGLNNQSRCNYEAALQYARRYPVSYGSRFKSPYCSRS